MMPLRLLLDENLSESVAARVAAAFPESQHVRRSIGVGATDLAVWTYAKRHGLMLVTLDHDFEHLSVSLGAPPKVVLLEAHNARSSALAALMLARFDLIERFAADPDAAMLVLRLPQPG